MKPGLIESLRLHPRMASASAGVRPVPVFASPESTASNVP